MSNDTFWTCPDCRQENFAQSRFCEVCGKQRGSAEPGPGPAVMAKLRGARASSEPPRSDPQPFEPAPGVDEEPADEPRAGRRVKVSFLDFGERIRGMFRRGAEGVRTRRRDAAGSPVLALALAFLLWAVIRLVGYVPLMLLLKFVAFLFTPLGLPVWMFMAWYYSQNRRAIHRAIDGTRRRVAMFAGAVSKAAGSIAMLRGGLMNMLGFGGAARGDEEARVPGTPVRGASVRILEEDWDDDDDFEEPPPPRRRR